MQKKLFTLVLLGVSVALLAGCVTKEETPVVEDVTETPVVEEVVAPVVEEVPVVEETPVAPEAPVLPEAPAAE